MGLIDAAQAGEASELRALLERRAHVDAQKDSGNTALSIAARNGDAECAALLIEFKASLDSQSRNGITALMHAARRGHADIVRCLIAAEASVNLKDNKGQTALSRTQNTQIQDVFSSHDVETMVLTLHIAGQVGDDDLADVSLTSMGGEEVAAVRVDPKQPLRDLRQAVMKQAGLLLPPQLMLPDGLMLSREKDPWPLSALTPVMGRDGCRIEGTLPQDAIGSGSAAAAVDSYMLGGGALRNLPSTRGAIRLRWSAQRPQLLAARRPW